MNEQDGTQATALQRPSINDRGAWQIYWRQQGQPWRWEPEIDVERQKYLDKRRKIMPFGRNIRSLEQVDFPFKDIKLSRADVEWLLSTRESSIIGLDLYCADLRGVSLRQLPLKGAIFQEAHLEKANLSETLLEEAILTQAYLEDANLNNANAIGANFSQAHMSGARINKAHLERSILIEARLEEATLYSTYLEDARLSEVHLERADLVEVHLEGADLSNAHLEGSHINGSFLNSTTKLRNVILGNEKFGFISVAGVHWGEVDLSVVDWTNVKVLGDEYIARQPNNEEGKPKNKRRCLDEYQAAVRAYRQLSIVLCNQGLNEDAARFAYRAQMLQRTVFRLKGGVRSFLQYLFSLFLDLLAGYGYKPWRSFLAYLLVITVFATAYFVIGHTIGPVLSPLGSFVFSMTSFHGRGFFPGGIQLDDPLTVLAALEAFVGLLIEVTFIATLTQRLFGK